MIEAGAPSTCRELNSCCPKRCARPTGDSHGRTTRGPAQRFKGAKTKAARKGEDETRGQGQYKGRSLAGAGRSGGRAAG